MKFKTTHLLLLLSSPLVGLNSAFGETCYQLTGTVDTVNLNPFQQTGAIQIATYVDDPNNAQYEQSGQIDGVIVGKDQDGLLLLDHTIKFSANKKGKGSGFSTEYDEAEGTVEKVLLDENGNPILINGEPIPCKINDVKETINHIVNGFGNFKNVTSANITAEGTVSFCPGDVNHNHFELSGGYCVGE